MPGLRSLVIHDVPHTTEYTFRWAAGLAGGWLAAAGRLAGGWAAGWRQLGGWLAAGRLAVSSGRLAGGSWAAGGWRQAAGS